MNPAQASQPGELQSSATPVIERRERLSVAGTRFEGWRRTAAAVKPKLFCGGQV